jgi:hypothetical protein
MATSYSIVPADRIGRAIVLLRGQKVMLDSTLAGLYEVETGALNRAVQRNLERFPSDFMFQLTEDEVKSLRCQTGISNKGRGGRRYLPFAFTEQGVAMLSSVLRSPCAVKVNIEIMRAFVKLRQLLATHDDLTRKLNEVEKKYDAQFTIVFEALRELMVEPEPPKKEIGFYVKERHAAYRVGRNGR